MGEAKRRAAWVAKGGEDWGRRGVKSRGGPQTVPNTAPKINRRMRRIMVEQMKQGATADQAYAFALRAA
jgi:hypothetical protein